MVVAHGVVTVPFANPAGLEFGMVNTIWEEEIVS